MAKKLKVEHKPGGYEGYKNQAPIRKPNWRVLLAMGASIFVCGAFAALLLFLVPQGMKFFNPPEPTIEILEVEVTEELAFNATISEALPTNTPTAMPSNTPEPTIRVAPTLDLEATLNAVQMELEALQSQPTQSALPTQTPNVIIEVTEIIIEPTAIIYDEYAVVTVDCSIIRIAPGREFRALDSACRGAEYPVLDTYGQWVQVLHPAHETAWIANWLVRIEQR